MTDERSHNQMKPSKFAVSRKKRKMIHLATETFSNFDNLQSIPPELFVSTKIYFLNTSVPCHIR